MNIKTNMMILGGCGLFGLLSIIYQHRLFSSQNVALVNNITKHEPVNQLKQQERFQRYKERYSYMAPASMNATERMELCGDGPDFSTYFNQPYKTRRILWRSVNDEDLNIYNLFFKDSFDSKYHGGVVEMGAYDGVQESNSRFFEYCLGWNSILVEGMPETYKKTVRNRPYSHRFNFAPSCSVEEDMANKMVKFDNYSQTNAGLGSNVSTAYSVKNWTVDVPCGSLTPILLDIFPKGHVSFFSLDVEGSEPSVVQNIDFNKVFIEVMIIEHANNLCNRNKCESRDKFRRIMDENGYIRFTRAIKKSDLFIHPKSQHLQTVFKNEKLKSEYENFMRNKNTTNAIPKGLHK